MRLGRYNIYLPCSQNTPGDVLQTLWESLSGSSQRVLDITLIRLPTQSYIVISIGEQETPLPKRYSAGRLVMWFYNPSPLMNSRVVPTGGLPVWILPAIFRQTLHHRISSAQATVLELYPIAKWFHPLDTPFTSVLDQENAWRAFTATIHHIHVRSYYASRSN